jgi:hypothetical protein
MVEIARMVADWLNGTKLDVGSASQSIGTQLAALSYDGSDTAPTTPTVYDETRDGNAARGDYPATVPALVVSVTDLRQDAAPFTAVEQQGTAQVLIRHIADNTTSSNAVRDGYYVLRGVRRSLYRLHGPGEANNGRKRNNIAIWTVQDEPMQYVKVTAAREDGDLLTGLIVNYVWRELAV